MTLGLVGAGLVMATGQAPLGWSWLAFLALMAGLFVALGAEGWRGSAWCGGALGFGYFCGTLFWIVEPFFVDAVRHAWMAPFALVGLAGFMASYWSLAFGLAGWLGRDRMRRAMWLVVLLSAAEMVRSYAFTGFAWALISYMWVDTPQLQSVALIGPYGLTLVTVAAAAVPGALGAARMLLGLFVGGAILSLPAMYGLWQMSQPVPPRESPLNVRIVQVNAPQHLKWHPDHIPTYFRRHLDLSAQEGETEPDLILWPETAVPYMLDQADEVLPYISNAAGDATVVFGIQRRAGSDAHNSLAAIDADGALIHVYDKHHLVPFGEFFPWAHFFGRFGLRGLAEAAEFGYTPGPGIEVLDLGPLGKMLPLICYEAIFPHDVWGAPERADWILHITNDAWFGNIAGPHQHLAQAQVRAVEQGLPVLRAANTGISAIIDARGQVLTSVPLNTIGTIDGVLPGSLPPTLYARSGDWPMVLFLLGLGTGLLLLTARKPVDRPSQPT